MRIEQLTFTRFLAAISIVIFHFGVEVWPFNDNSFSFLFEKANMGVSYFFVLSGFVMIIAYYHRTGLRQTEYLKNRIIRIYPVYLLALLVYVAYLIRTGHSITGFAVVLNLFVLQSWVPGYAHSLNYTGWSLSVELFFYLIFPLLLDKVYRSGSVKTISFYVISFWIVSQLLFIYLSHSSFNTGLGTPGFELIFTFPLMHFNEFLIGNLIGLVFLSRNSIEKYNHGLLLVIIMVLTIVVLNFFDSKTLHNGAMAIVFAPFILILSLNQGWFSRFLQWKPFVFLGNISYGLYILQVPVFEGVYSLMLHFKIANPTLRFYAGFFVLILAAIFSYILVERPLIRKFRRPDTGA